MPAPELNGRYEPAVLWEFAGVNEFGRPVLYSPIELTVRWENTQRQAATNQQSSTRIDADVFVDREIAISSIMRLGALEDLPLVPDNLMQVIGYDETKDIKSRVGSKTVQLQRYTDVLPDVVGSGS